MQRTYLSVVIPCYNEESNIRKGVLVKIIKFLKSKKFPWEMIIVDDGSTDKSLDLLEKFTKENPGVVLLRNPHLGKAAAVITGVLRGRGQYILFSDLDQATPISELNKILPYFEKGYQIVIGSRNSERRGAPFSRVLMARGFMILRDLFLGVKGIYDTQCGFKAFTKKAAKDLFKSLKVYAKSREIKGSMVSAGFDVELLYLAKKRGYPVKEVPVIWNYVETRRVSPIKDSWDGFLDLIKIKINDLKGKYDRKKTK